MCGIELMFYSECSGSRGLRGLAGGKKTHLPEQLTSLLSTSFPSTLPGILVPALESCWNEPLSQCDDALCKLPLMVVMGLLGIYPMQRPQQPTLVILPFFCSSEEHSCIFNPLIQKAEPEYPLRMWSWCWMSQEMGCWSWRSRLALLSHVSQKFLERRQEIMETLLCF